MWAGKQFSPLAGCSSSQPNAILSFGLRQRHIFFAVISRSVDISPAGTEAENTFTPFWWNDTAWCMKFIFLPNGRTTNMSIFMVNYVNFKVTLKLRYFRTNEMERNESKSNSKYKLYTYRQLKSGGFCLRCDLPDANSNCVRWILL